MKFRAVRGSVRLASTSGHVVIVTEGWTEVPDCLEKEALANGCISQEMANAILGQNSENWVPPDQNTDETGTQGNNEPGTDPQDEIKAKRINDIVRAIETMAKENNPKYFTKRGEPNKVHLKNFVGYQFSEEEYEEAWGKIKEAMGKSGD